MMGVEREGRGEPVDCFSTVPPRSEVTMSPGEGRSQCNRKDGGNWLFDGADGVDGLSELLGFEKQDGSCCIERRHGTR